MSAAVLAAASSAFDASSPFSQSLSSWMAVHGKIRKTAGVVTEAQLARCSELFAMLDANSNGFIELDELVSAMQQLDLHTDKKKIKEALSDFVTKQDGLITYGAQTDTHNSKVDWGDGLLSHSSVASVLMCWLLWCCPSVLVLSAGVFLCVFLSPVSRLSCTASARSPRGRATCPICSL